MEKAVQTRLVK